VHAAASGEQFRQFVVGLLAERDKINRLAPGGGFLSSTGRNHLADDRRQQNGRVLPPDQVKALERLIDEVERMPAVGECPVGFGREQGIGEESWRDISGNRRE